MSTQRDYVFRLRLNAAERQALLLLANSDASQRSEWLRRQIRERAKMQGIWQQLTERSM